jgi:hypothetical protein
VTWPGAVREFVIERAIGRCEYCLLHQTDAGFPHQIDHILSRKHGGSSHPDNLAFACYLCNRYKGSDIASVHPDTHELVRLFHPRRDRWTEHFQITGSVIEPRTTIGAATAHLLRFNAPERVIERQLLQTLSRYSKA